MRAPDLGLISNNMPFVLHLNLIAAQLGPKRGMGGGARRETEERADQGLVEQTTGRQAGRATEGDSRRWA